MSTHRARRRLHMPSPQTRAYIYRVAVAFEPIAVGYGLITHEHGGLWVAALGTILGVGTSALAAANTKGTDE